MLEKPRNGTIRKWNYLLRFPVEFAYSCINQVGVGGGGEGQLSCGTVQDVSEEGSMWL
jgi:hypothetical protein